MNEENLKELLSELFSNMEELKLSGYLSYDEVQDMEGRNDEIIMLIQKKFIGKSFNV